MVVQPLGLVMPRKLLVTAAAAAFGVLLVLLGLMALLVLSDHRALTAVQAELAQTRALLPTQSSAIEVDFQVSSLWFAAKAGNWELADFLLEETEEHIGWAVSLQPVRRTQDGTVDLRPLYDIMQRFSLREVGAAIEARDPARFEEAYGFMLEQCHGCHVAAEMPYLRPHIPEAPATRMIEMAPTAQ